MSAELDAHRKKLQLVLLKKKKKSYYSIYTKWYSRTEY